MVLGSTQPLVKMSTGNISWELKAGGAWGWQPYHLRVPNVMEIWEPKPPGTLWTTPGLLRDCFTFTFTCHRFCVTCTCGFTPLPLDIMLIKEKWLFQLNFPLKNLKTKICSRNFWNEAQTPPIELHLKYPCFNQWKSKLFGLHCCVQLDQSHLLTFLHSFFTQYCRNKALLQFCSCFVFKHYWCSFCCRGYHRLLTSGVLCFTLSARREIS
jgi:hypothetical protein